MLTDVPREDFLNILCSGKTLLKIHGNLDQGNLARAVW